MKVGMKVLCTKTEIASLRIFIFYFHFMIAVNNSFELVVQEKLFNFVKDCALSLVLERSIRQQRTKYGDKHLKGSGKLKTDISPKMCCYDHYL